MEKVNFVDMRQLSCHLNLFVDMSLIMRRICRGPAQVLSIGPPLKTRTVQREDDPIPICTYKQKKIERTLKSTDKWEKIIPKKSLMLSTVYIMSLVSHSNLVTFENFWFFFWQLFSFLFFFRMIFLDYFIRAQKRFLRLRWAWIGLSPYRICEEVGLWMAYALYLFRTTRTTSPL